MDHTLTAGEHPAVLVARRAAAAPRAVAYVEGATGAALTWADVAAGADHWRALAAALPEGTRVGLLADSPIEAVRAFLGGLAAGVVLAPLDPGARAGELAAAASRLGIGVVVADEASTDLATGLAGAAGLAAHSTGVGGLEPLTAASGRLPAGTAAPGAAALLMSSSGTTGDPKLIPLRADQLLRTAAAVVDAHGLTDGDVGYSPLPLWHINGLVVGVLSTLCTGGRLVVDRRFSARRFWPVVEATGATWLNLVSAIIAILGRSGGPSDDVPDGVAGRVRFARSASAPLSAAAREGFEARTGIAVIETYGMTEVASQICANPLEEAARRPGTVGPATDVELRVAAGPGEAGEVMLRGPRVTDTYWVPGGSATRPATDPDGWLATGDLGILDHDGYLTLVGRVDDVINRGGEKVFPREVEEVLLADPAVAAAAVVGRPDPLLGAVPVAYVTLVDGAAADDDARAAVADRLSATTRDHLSRPKRPVEVHVVDSLPVGATGKVKHAAIRRAMSGGAPAATGDPPPAAPLRPDTGRGAEGSAAACDTLDTPPRTAKPRSSGITMVIDGGQPTGFFLDAVRSYAEHIDVVKFGWGTALVTPDLDTKLAALRELGIRYYFGGTLFEKFVTQDRFEAFLAFAADKGVDTVEISNGTIPLTNTGKAAYIRKA
ncbi:MAG TPA: AMP-binding protein, partial [Acidimicrobiales bacterium]|nr:AMP-binding protein [Acidimicrobiales bacterium]